MTLDKFSCWFPGCCDADTAALDALANGDFPLCSERSRGVTDYFIFS